MLHEPAVEVGADYASKKKTRLGVILFTVYATIYALFVLFGLFYTDLLGLKAIGNINLAVVYGIGLILLAAIMGFVYNLVCSRMEDQMNGGAKL
jgi:uncharacterized membrane protein (DUF485 family)